MRSRWLDLAFLLVLVACMALVWHYRHRPTSETLRAEREQAQALLDARQWREAGLHLERALRMARELEMPEAEYELLDDLGWAHYSLGETAQAARWQAEAVEVVERVRGPNDPTLGLYLSRLAMVTPDRAQALAMLSRAESIYRKSYQPGPTLDGLLRELESTRARLGS